jgi:UDP-2,4-diacetamido-2,4,6-trideoxy-beta-L-altropyranose hydrolase
MRLLIRCDADGTIGLGHAGRALALAEELGQRLGVVPCIISRQDSLLRRFLEDRPVDQLRVEHHGYDVETVLEAAAGDDAIVISDTYELDESAMSAISSSGARHVVIDDFARLDEWPCDVVVNPNVGAETGPYKDASRVVVGPRYALLRREIRALARRPVAVRGTGSRLLICLGGGLWAGRAAELLVALGELTDRGVEVRAAVEDMTLPSGVAAVPPSDLPQQLAWADVGVLSGGVLKYEAAAAALPMLLLAAVDHQVPVAEAFAVSASVQYLGELRSLDGREVAGRALALLRRSDERLKLALRARELVDGRGVERVAALLLTGDEA